MEEQELINQVQDLIYKINDLLHKAYDMRLEIQIKQRYTHQYMTENLSRTSLTVEVYKKLTPDVVVYTGSN